ncbi:MAG: WD40 repeat domain-containing protein [Candidatus Helarchaeota archaeon]
MKRKTFNLLLINLLILIIVFSHVQFSSLSNSILWTFITPLNEIPNKEITPSFSENLMWNHGLAGRVYDIAISNDSEYIAAGSGGGRVYFYFKNGTLKWDYHTGGAVETGDISEDRYYIVMGSCDNRVYLFNKTSSTPMWSYLTGDDVRNSVAISTNGDYMVAGSWDDKVYLFNKSKI